MDIRKILIVEDQALARAYLCSCVEKCTDCEVAGTLTRADAALRRCSEGRIDLILMDIQMPVMNGYEATEQIRALEDPALAKIRILAMTANAFDEDRKQALKCGMDGFLSKPIVIEELIHTLQTNLK